MGRYAAVIRGSDAKNNPHVIIATHQNAPIANRKVVANAGAYFCTVAKAVTTNINSVVM